LYLSGNTLTGTIPSQIALMSNLSESGVAWLLVVMIVMCVFHCTLMLAFVIYYSTAGLDLSGNSLMGMIPSQIGLLSNFSESSVVWLLVVMIVLCVYYCTLMLVLSYSFYRYVGSLVE
jgi:hypothetical protein